MPRWHRSWPEDIAGWASRAFRSTLLIAAFVASGLTACDGPNDPDPPTGSLALAVSGLPDPVDAEITLTGPGGFSSRVTGTQTFSALPPGAYTIAATRVRTSAATFDPAFESLSVTVSANSVSQATVIYTIVTGSISIAVAGLPPDVPWKVIIDGPGGFRDSVSVNTTLGNLTPGLYTVTTSEVRKGVNLYLPKVPVRTLTVPASITPVAATITFQLTTGSLTLHVNGLPTGTSANLTITGPGGFTVPATGSGTLDGLEQGRYTISASPVGVGSTQYSPSPAQQGITIVAGSVGLASVNYWPGISPPGLNLAIDAMHLQQVVQTYGGAVATVAGRDALLRVFVRASEPNGASAAVRVRLFDGTTEVGSATIPSPAPGVPVTIDEGSLAASWNYTIPAALVRPGLRILADVDPTNAIVESVENDNGYPSSGSPLVIDVRTTPPLAVRLIPVTQSVTGLTGDITSANVPLFHDAARRLLPVDNLSVELRATYTSNGPALLPNDENGAWVQLLSEINALRTAEGSSAHYYGVVHVPYTAGVIGISFLPSFVAIGWDAPSNAHWTFVHELGHHFGRLHSPACGAGGFDAQYPYPNGTIGVFGFDGVRQALLPPSTPDIMTYCSDRWISDHTYMGILGFRAAQSNVLSNVAAAGTPRPGLLVWGRISKGGPILEPAFEVTAPATLPTAGGPHRIEMLDSAGKALLSLSFAGEPVVDNPARTDQSFAFLVPWELVGNGTPARLRLTTTQGRAELAASPRRTSSQLADDFSPTVERLSPSRLRVRWRDAPGRGVLVRDASGAILAFARGGHADVVTRARRVDLTLSDGVRSARRTVEIR